MKKILVLVTGIFLGALLAAFAFAVSSKTASAQDPVKLSPQYYKVLLENDEMRIIEYRLKPGEKEPMHSHPFGVAVYSFSDSKLRTTLPDGKTAEALTKSGDVIWRAPVTHAGENIGNTEVHALLIEPKNHCK